MDANDPRANATIPNPISVGWGAWHGRNAPDGTRNGVRPLGGPAQSISKRADAARDGRRARRGGGEGEERARRPMG
jgi:hypothetical protein